VLSILEASPVEQVGGRGVISLPGLVSVWATLIEELKVLGAQLGVERARFGLMLQTYGSDQDEHIYDLVFDDHPAPKQGGKREMPPPPWTISLEPKPLTEWGRNDLRPAIIDLLDRFSYRHAEKLLDSLGLIDGRIQGRPSPEPPGDWQGDRCPRCHTPISPQSVGKCPVCVYVWTDY